MDSLSSSIIYTYSTIKHTHYSLRLRFCNVSTCSSSLFPPLSGFVSHRVVFNHFCNPSPDVKSNRTGIQLLGVVVANHLSPYDPDTAGAIEEQRFYTTFASLMSHKYKEIYAAAAEVMGMVLAFLQDKSHVMHTITLIVIPYT